MNKLDNFETSVVHTALTLLLRDSNPSRSVQIKAMNLLDRMNHAALYFGPKEPKPIEPKPPAKPETIMTLQEVRRLQKRFPKMTVMDITAISIELIALTLAEINEKLSVRQLVQEDDDDDLITSTGETWGEEQR